MLYSVNRTLEGLIGKYLGEEITKYQEEQSREQNEEGQENSTFKSEYEQEFDEIIALMEKIFEADEMSIQKAR